MGIWCNTMLLLAATSLTVVESHYYQGSSPYAPLVVSNPYLQQSYAQSAPQRYDYQRPVGHKHKPIQVSLPVSPIYDVEIIKPMAQLQEKKSVPLFIIPQNSLHVYPHIQRKNFAAQFGGHQKQYHAQHPDLSQFMGDPSHLPAIEIPLAEPMVLGSVESQVLAPIGFTALFNGPDGSSFPYQIHTAVLLAPVPPGTIVSDQTPVIITTIYAVPKLSVFPSYYPILADFPTNLLQGPAPTVGTAKPFKPTTVVPVAASLQPVDAVSVPISPEEGPEPKFPTSVPTPATSFQEVTESDNEVPNLDAVPPSGIVSGTAPEFVRQPFINSKESPFLQELREQSIRRQIVELQAQLNALLRIRNY